MNLQESSPTPLPLDLSGLNWRHLPRPINTLADYEPSRHAKTYLRALAQAAGLPLENPSEEEIFFNHFHRRRPDERGQTAMMAAGFAHWGKFLGHLDAWHDLARPVPRAYAEFIGVNEEELRGTVAADQVEYALALELPLRPRSWTLRVFAAMYQSMIFPLGCETEADCVAHVRDFCRGKPVRACISTPGLKTLWIEPPEGRVDVTLYRPTLKITRRWITFAYDGRIVGTMWLR